MVELADIPGGYGWVFPKGDHVNVGVGAWQNEGPRIREHLARVCRAHGLDPAQLDSMRGHRLPLRRGATRLAGERALLVGDAAGLIDPVSGDGMYECFVSSRLAAEAILDRAGSTRTRRARRRCRAAPQRVVEAQAGARPLAARELAGRAHAAPLAFRRAAAARRRRRTGRCAGVARVPLRLLDTLARF